VAYIGNPPTVGQWRKLDDISGSFNGSTTTFTTSVGGSNVTAGSANQLFVSLGGVIQQPNVDYSVTTNSIIFTTAPTSGLDFFAVLAGDALNTAVPADGSITTAKLAGNLTVDLDSGSAAAPSLTFDSDTGLYSPGADQLALSTNGSQRVTVDANGRVLVGTNASTSGGGGDLLEVASSVGNILITSTNSTRVADQACGQLRFWGQAGANEELARIAAIADGTHGSGDKPTRLVFSTTSDGTSSPTERLRITSAGLVGIGTSSVDRLLHVEHPTENILARFESGDLNAAIEFADNTTTTAPTIGANGDNLRLGTGGTSAIEIDSSQRVGIGTTVPIAKTHILVSDVAGYTSPAVDGLVIERTGSNVGINIASDNNRSGYLIFADGDATSPASIRYDHSGDTMSFTVNGSERVRIDSSGRLLVGTSSNHGTERVLINGNSASAGDGSLTIRRGSNAGNGDGLGLINFADTRTSSLYAQIQAIADSTPGTNDFPGALVFSTTSDGASSPTERMRIGSDGTSYFQAPGNVVGAITYTSAGTSQRLYYGSHSGSGISGTISFTVWTNGNVVNTNNSYGAISDIKLKENIVDASSQWDDIKALRPVNYNFKEGQTHTQLGLIAQEVELVSPGLVTESPDRDEDGNDLGTVTKSVNYSVLYMKAVKALQEAMERIEQLETEMAAVKAQLA